MKRSIALLLSCTLILGSFTGCASKLKDKIDSEGGTSSVSEGSRATVTDFIMPKASGKTTYGNKAISIDASNTRNGYVMIKYSGKAKKVQVQINNPDGTLYPYPLQIGGYQTFPLTGGNGSYKISVLEHVKNDMYSVGVSQTIKVKLKDEYRPYLYPNQYVNYTKESEAVDLGMKLSDKSSDDLNFVTHVYEYVIKNIAYDTDKAKNVSVNYIPDVDSTLASKKGICFDYASLMSSLLRSQKIPTKLVVGYSGTAYHAWISVYIDEIGWVDDIIQFDGNDWSLMDPTLAANNDGSSVKEYVGNGSNYTAKYTY